MSIMKALTLDSAGALPQVTSDIPIPQPGEGQILVKTSYAAINPIDNDMASSGFMVLDWPFTPGCDASGTVVKVGANAASALGKQWKKGDKVFGCTRLGAKGYAAWAEYFLFDANLCIPVPPNLSLPAAAGTGVAVLTACLGVFDGLAIDLENLPKETGKDWALVFGGAGSVGQFAVQMLKAAGFNVVATASTKSSSLLQSLGASATIDYNLPTEEVIAQLKTITSGSLTHAFDATSKNNALLTSILNATASPRRYTTTNDWDPLPTAASGSDFTAKPMKLGLIGQPDAVEFNEMLNKIIPVAYGLLDKGVVKPSEYSVEGEGLEDVLGAWEVQKSGKMGSTKVIVKIGGEPAVGK